MSDTKENPAPTARVIHADCLSALREMPDASVDAIVTDPPYGLSNTTPAQVAETITQWVTGDREYLPSARGFMGHEWDGFVPPVAVWDECLRVLKPGGHLLAFAGSRTHDLMTLGIRLAGFEIRDSVAWLYGSGFPKSMDVSKAIDKRRTEDFQPAADVARWLVEHMELRGITRRDICDHFSAANIAQQWTTYWTDGAVKPRVPRWEQWVELRRWLDLPDDMDAEVWRLNGRKGKPGENWYTREVTGHHEAGNPIGVYEFKHGGGKGRTANERRDAPATDDAKEWEGWGTALKPAFEPVTLARKPLAGTVAATVLEHGTGALNIDGCRIQYASESDRDQTRVPQPVQHNDAHAVYQLGTGQGRNGETFTPAPAGRWPANVVLDESQAVELDRQAGASRFFYVAKAPKSERPVVDGTAHPTVKPLTLMRWLVRMVTPPGGVVVDPFAGSGTTVEAALAEGFDVVGIEREASYLPLIQARIDRITSAD